MRTPPERTSLRRMQALFGTIAPKYDFITRVFSYGMDREWKRRAVEGAGLPPGAKVLDLACGTADFSALLGRGAVAADLTFEMLPRARSATPLVVNADAMRLPFASGTFDAVFMGYGIRNFPDHTGALNEIVRVLKPGGKLVTLDFFQPPNALLRTLFLGYLYAQGAFWGLVLHGSARVYTYIPDSLRSFMTGDRYERLERLAGFAEVLRQQWIFGGVAVHWATTRRPL